MTNYIPTNTSKNEATIRRTADGNIDTNYYIEKGRNARSDAAIRLISTIRNYWRKKRPIQQPAYRKQSTKL